MWENKGTKGETNLESVLPREGLVTPVTGKRLDGPVYPLVPLKVMVPREGRRALVALMRLVRRPLLRLEHHPAEVAPVPRRRLRRVVRHQRHGLARVAQVVHVLVLLRVATAAAASSSRRVRGHPPRPTRLWLLLLVAWVLSCASEWGEWCCQAGAC